MRFAAALSSTSARVMVLSPTLAAMPPEAEGAAPFTAALPVSPVAAPQANTVAAQHSTAIGKYMRGGPSIPSPPRVSCWGRRFYTAPPEPAPRAAFGARRRRSFPSAAVHRRVPPGFSGGGASGAAGRPEVGGRGGRPA